jgi:hypothetical protein
MIDNHARVILSIVLVVCLVAGMSSSQAVELADSVPAFLQSYCIRCHHDENEKGDRSFVPLLNPRKHAASDDDEVLTLLTEVVDQLNLGEMPPRDADVVQPNDNERADVIAEITRYLLFHREQGKPTSTVMRRLTRYEYKNTLRDLLGIDTEASDQTTLFPSDTKLDGFSNIGSEQPLSEQQLQLYMSAARRYLDEALVFGQPQPTTQSWSYKPENFNYYPFTNISVIYRVLHPSKRFIDIGHGEPVERYATYPTKLAEKGVPSSGYYRIRVKAEGVGRKHPYDPSLFNCDLTVPLKLGIWHVPESRWLAPGASEGRVFAGAFDLRDNEPSWVETTAWMPAGSSVFVHWINGLGSPKPLFNKLRPLYHPETTTLTDVEVDELHEQGKPIPVEKLNPPYRLPAVYQGPRVRLYEMTIEGPLHARWPSEGHRLVVGEELDPTAVDIQKLLVNFATKAFRRPVTVAEVEHYERFVRQKIEANVPDEEAIKLGLAAILTSPRFLFLDEGDADADRLLDDYELATRLSYFLWSSMPDERLLELAARNELRNPNALAIEAERMLRDERGSAFTEHFTDAWLRLDKLGSMPPSTAEYPTYYFHRLERAMKGETRALFQHILTENRPVTEFIDAPYTFVNDALARHYGIDGVMGESFQKVDFPQGVHRGGLLGHASVLTATANGVETSPVVRGVWVLESLLGTPPAPPPPDVPPIEPDTRGATTIREQLEKHRTVSACADCHAKIDPWGFVLEYFDPIGGFRESYTIFSGTGRVARRSDGKAIDAVSQLPSGAIIRDEADLRKELLVRQDQFARNLTKKLLMYACGRELTFADAGNVEKISKRVVAQEDGLRDLVLAIVVSETFRSR